MPWYNPFEDTGVGPQDIGKPINIDPLGSLQGRPRFRSRRDRDRAGQMAAERGRDASSTKPLGHWTQALAQVLEGGLSGYEERVLAKEDAARREYMASALEGKMSPEDLMKEGALYDVPELTDIGQYREGEADEDRRFEYTQGRDVAADAWREKEFAADEAYRYRPEKPQRYRIGENLVDESGNVVYEGAPKPPKKTESQLRGETVQQGAQHSADVLFAKGTPDNPVPGLDELGGFWNTAGANMPIGGGYIMSESAQKTTDALNTLTQQYIYAISGAEAPAAEVQRKAQTVVPSPGDAPSRILEKKKEVANMWATIQRRAASGLAPGEPESGTPDAGGFDFGDDEIGAIPEGSEVEDDTGVRYRKQNGELIRVQ